MQPASMIPVEEARERILARFARLPAERKPLLDAIGQVLAEDVIAPFDIPPLDIASMDGYAVRAMDTFSASGTSPVQLEVIATLAAGQVSETSTGPGQAIRIMTGTPIPPGADAVVPFEETDDALRHPARPAARRETVAILGPAASGSNIRRRAGDVHEGQRVLAAGRVVRPYEVGVLASIGVGEVAVARRPVVAILSTGDEVTPIGEPLQPGRFYDTNSLAIASQVQTCGGIPRLLGIAPDTVGGLTARIRQGLDADMLVTSAGVSRGGFDVVKEALAREGASDSWTVRMRPGKQLVFGVFTTADGRHVPHLGLSGNPVSAMVSFELFGRPAIFKMLGRNDWQRPVIRAIARQAIRSEDGRRFYARCIVSRGEDGRLYADLTAPQGSSILTGMSSANALTVIHEDSPTVSAGDEIDVMLIDWEHAP